MYYKKEAGNLLKIRLEAPVDGWVAFAVGSSMPDADAVIGGGSNSGGRASDIRAYKITARSLSGVVENAAATKQLTNTEVLHEGGKTIIIFTRPLDNGVKTITYDGDTSIIYAFGSGNTISYHGTDKRVNVINFAAGESTVDTTARDNKVFHGSLMMLGWGFLLPLGTLTAAWAGPRFKSGGPKAFNVHRTVQSLGLLVAITGAVYALVQIYDAAATMPFHGILGTIVMIVGVLQPLNAFFRPHGDGNARVYWELLHKNAGRGATFLGVCNCILGSMLARRQHEGEEIFDALLIISFILASVFALAWSVFRAGIHTNGAKSEVGEDDAQNEKDPELELRSFESR